jgi:hypothetical protein
MSALLTIVGSLVSLLVWWVKHKETPQTRMKRIAEETEADLEKVDEAIASGDMGRVDYEFSRLRRRILLETTGHDNRGGEAG